MPQARGPLWILVVLIFFTGVAYSPGLSGGFVFDSIGRVALNPAVEIDALTWEALTRAALAHDSLTNRPLAMASFGITHALADDAPFWLKAGNLAIHLVNGLLVYLLGRLLLTALAGGRPGGANSRTAWAAVALAGFWLLAPLQLTSVLYVVQRMTSLSALFVFGGLALYGWGRLRQWQGRRGAAFLWLGILGGGALAMLAKENGVLIVPLALLVEVVVFRFRRGAGGWDWAALTVHGSLWAFGAIATVFVAATSGLGWLVDGYTARPFTLWERILTQARALWLYVRLLLAPVPDMLSLWHDDFSLSRGLLQPVSTAGALAAWVVAILGGGLLRHRAPLVTLGVGWFLVGHALESTIIALEMVHEHRNYLPSFGVYLALLGGVYHFVTTTVARWVVAGGLVLLAILFWDGLAWRATQWQDPLTLAAAQVQSKPDSVRARHQAAARHIELAEQGSAPYRHAGKAYGHLRHSWDLGTPKLVPEAGLLFLHNRFGTTRPKGLWEAMQAKAGRYPLHAEDVAALRVLAQCRWEGNCALDDWEMVATLRRFTAKSKKTGPLAEAWQLLGRYLLRTMESPEAAEAAFRAGVRRFPGEVPLKMDLARTLGAQDELEAGRRWLAKARSADTLGRYTDSLNDLEEQFDAAARD